MTSQSNTAIFSRKIMKTILMSLRKTRPPKGYAKRRKEFKIY
jgi:hypothetical protein